MAMGRPARRPRGSSSVPTSRPRTTRGVAPPSIGSARSACRARTGCCGAGCYSTDWAARSSSCSASTSHARAGLVISLYAAGGLFAGPIAGALADRVGRRATLLAGTAGAGALMLALGFARSTTAIVALAPWLGLFTDACRPPLQAAVADVVPPEDRARAYGLLYWAINLGFAGASVFGGALAER